MAVLILELHGLQRGAVLPARLLIGRRSMNHLVIDHPTVSRMHAWIDGEGDRYYINDAGSRTGTRVNGQRIVARHLLGDEDEISIGPATLTFLADPRVRDDIEPLDLPESPIPAPGEEGIAFECPSCTAPLWAAPQFAGTIGQCRYCGHSLAVPAPKKPKARPRPPHAKRAAPEHLATPPAGAAALPPRTSAPATVNEAGAKPTQPPVQVGRGPFDDPDESLEAQIPGPFEPPAADELAEQTEPPAAAEAATPIQSAAPINISAPTGFSGPAVTPARTDLVTPAPARSPAAPLRAGAAEEQICGACQSPISIFEERTVCPNCGLVFHADCWTENYGCSAYGCPQVNILKPPDPEPSSDAGADEAAHEQNAEDAVKPFPWEFTLLAGSVFSALLGALTFGLPPLALASGAGIWMARNRGRAGGRRAVVIVSTALALLGTVTGATVSWFYYFGAPRI